LSDNARLSDLKINDITIDGFDPLRTEYQYDLTSGTVEIPEIDFMPADTSASVSVIKATAIPGATKIVVTAENGITEKTYTVNFTFATNLKATQSSFFKVYPNPVSNILNVELSGNSGETDYVVYSVDGRIQNTGRIHLEKFTIDLKGLHPGIYFLNIEGMNQTVKLIKN
jgi:cytochrome c biogenesis protein ResB